MLVSRRSDLGALPGTSPSSTQMRWDPRAVTLLLWILGSSGLRPRAPLQPGPPAPSCRGTSAPSRRWSSSPRHVQHRRSGSANPHLEAPLRPGDGQSRAGEPVSAPEGLRGNHHDACPQRVPHENVPIRSEMTAPVIAARVLATLRGLSESTLGVVRRGPRSGTLASIRMPRGQPARLPTWTCA
jgi:hypothetical protein